MNAKEDRSSSNDKSATSGSKLSDEQVKELDLAGGVEGGMAAGSAGGPSQSDVERQTPSRLSKHRLNR